MAEIFYDHRPELAGLELPYSLEAEQSVLGAVLLDSSCLSAVLDSLRPGAFYRQEHMRLFEIMLRLFTTGQPVDFVTVLEAACREDVFPSEAEAKIYLAQLTQIVPSTRNVEAYANIVREKGYLRSLMGAAQEMIENSRSSGEDAHTIMDFAEQRIFDIRSERHGSKLLPIDAILLDIYDRLQRLSGEGREQYLGIPTGFGELDRLMTGLNRSDLILLAARPGMGKTSFALNIASHVAIKEGKTVAIFSLEMSREQLGMRLLSAESQVDSKKLQTGRLTPDEWNQLAKAAANISRTNLWIDDNPALTVSDMNAQCRRVKGLGLVVIDYLQLMTSAGFGQGAHNQNRTQIVSEISRFLKIMAKELNVPLVTLSQLNRASADRANKRPVLSDLRESGSIEQDADIVMGLYREGYYEPETENPNAAECIILKNRHGEVGTVDLLWQPEFTSYASLDRWHHDG